MKVAFSSSLLLAFIIGASGCGNKSDDGGKKSPPAQAPAGSPQKNVELPDDVGGNILSQNTVYSSECKEINYDYANLKFKRMQVSYNFSGGNFERVQKYFNADTCVGDATIVRETGNVVTLPVLPKLKDATYQDFSIEHVDVTVFNAFVVDQFNDESTCGISTWAVGIEQEISVQNSQSSCIANTAPRSERKLVLVEKSKLYFDDNGEVEVNTDLPKKVDRKIPYSKAKN